MSQLSFKQRLALEAQRHIIKEEVRQHPLLQLFWECTLRCNMRCRHCGSDCKISELQPDMPFEDFEKVLLRIKEVYDSHKILIILSGGEPLVREDLAACGRRIAELEFPWGIVSNGRLMSKSKIDEMLRSGMRAATISLDGFEDEHDWMRGTPGAFTHAVEAIKILSKSPIAFDVVTCVNQKNFARLEEFKEYLISIGLKAWRIFTVFPVGRAADDPELQLNAEQYTQLMDFIVKTREEGRIKLEYACEGFLGRYEGKVRNHLYTCQAGLSVASVRIDGSISGCNSVRAHFDQGNIYKDDFVDVWENRFQQFRNRDWAKAGKCAECKFWKYCEGNGMHLHADDGSLIMCNLERIV